MDIYFSFLYVLLFPSYSYKNLLYSLHILMVLYVFLYESFGASLFLSHFSY